MITANIRQNISEVQTHFRAAKREMERAVKAGMRAAKEPIRDVLKTELRKTFHVKQDRFLRTWRIAVRSAPKITIENVSKGFELHATGGSIGPRNRGAVLIPFNTRGGTRIGTKKFYSMIDWLHQEKLLFARNGILYVKPVMNTSRRGGVAVGTRINKKFRSRFQGPNKRPSGFEIKLNEQGLTPIAVIRRSISMRKRFDMDSLVPGQLIPILMKNIENELRLGRPY